MLFLTWNHFSTNLYLYTLALVMCRIIKTRILELMSEILTKMIYHTLYVWKYPKPLGLGYLVIISSGNGLSPIGIDSS